MLNINLINAIKGGIESLSAYFNAKNPRDLAIELNLPCDVETGDYALHIVLRKILMSLSVDESFSGSDLDEEMITDNVSSIDVVRLFISFGADPTLCNKKGESALSLLGDDQETLTTMLIHQQHENPFLNVFLPAVVEQNQSMINGYFAKSRNTVPKEALHFLLATTAPDLTILELILNNAQNIDILTTRNQAGETPLQVAYKRQLSPHLKK
jgi:hypothetical protein